MFYDADSHIMELPDFLRDYADPSIREQIPQVSYAASLVTDEEVELIVGNGNRHTAEHIEAQIGLGDQLIAQSKEIQALGAFDRDDRSVALDMLGFRKQLVFATHSVATPFSPSRKLSNEVRYGATRAHNRAMSEFCAADDRLMGVGIVPLEDPELALAELDFALDAGLEAIWVPHHPAGRAVAWPRRPRPVLGEAGGVDHSVSPPRRWLAAAARPTLGQHRSARRTRLDGRWRERPQQGHGRPASRAGDVHLGDGHGRRVRTTS